MRIFACHLLNDYSGSPKVLKQLINGWVKNRKNVTILTCYNRDGFLSNINGVNYSNYWYKWSSNNLVRLVNYFLSQIILFLKISKLVTKNDIVYINTILPFGAALAAKLKGCKVIYHVHEISIKPRILNWFLFKIVSLSSSRVIYVSNYLKNSVFSKLKNNIILYNALDDVFLREALKYNKEKSLQQNVLMISSLKIYKGVNEFVELAKLNPQLNFRLVLNANQSEIDVFFKEGNITENLKIYPTQLNTHPFYQWADVILNLSRPDGWIETFGLTIIEAMAYKLPAIVPPIGGISELVSDYENGFLVDSRNMKLLSNTLNLLLKDKSLYEKMRIKSFYKLKEFSETEFIGKSMQSLN
ncbi:MAG: glycosyltransferase family 4 protein [Bacteroidota bacterium]|nr:glycosyltransferase family 4 protein [Bacteroidota bacterium]